MYYNLQKLLLSGLQIFPTVIKGLYFGSIIFFTYEIYINNKILFSIFLYDFFYATLNYNMMHLECHNVRFFSSLMPVDVSKMSKQELQLIWYSVKRSKPHYLHSWKKIQKFMLVEHRLPESPSNICRINNYLDLQIYKTGMLLSISICIYSTTKAPISP